MKKKFYRAVIVLQIYFYWVVSIATKILYAIGICSVVAELRWDDKYEESYETYKNALSVPQNWECFKVDENGDACDACWICGYNALELAKKIR